MSTNGVHSKGVPLCIILEGVTLFHLGLFIDSMVDVARKELAWEVDYLREAECSMKFK